MSASQCIKCENIVGGYEKYCDECVKKYRVAQDVNWHKTHYFEYWQVERMIEFEKDLLLVPPRITNFARLQTETIKNVNDKKPGRRRHRHSKK